MDIIQENQTEERKNPFFSSSYGTPHDTAPFDRIHLEDYEPAFMEGIRQDDELTDTIIDKSQRGVFVKFFINNVEKQPDADKLLRYKGRFLQIYDYSNDEDKMAALHAKVISVDMKQTLITSANLSYHGQQGNIELGALIESENTAKQLDEVMTQLIFKKIFREV